MKQKINKVFLIICCFLLTACQLREQQQYLTFIDAETIEYEKNFNACSLVDSADGYDKEAFIYSDEKIELPNGKTIMCNMENKKPKLDTVKYTFHYRNQDEIKRIKFVDTTPPKISNLKKEYEVQKGNEYFDLKNLIKVEDNYDTDIIVSFNGSYDIDKVGIYTIEVIAEDSNKNQTKATTQVIIKEEEVKEDYSNNSSISNNGHGDAGNSYSNESNITNSPSSTKKETKYFSIDEYSSFDQCLNACNSYISGSNAMCVPYPANEQIKKGYEAIFQ